MINTIFILCYLNIHLIYQETFDELVKQKEDLFSLAEKLM